MIRLALAGKTSNDIAIHRNQKGVLTNRGNHWSGMAVQRLLVDETHLGKIISNKTQGDAHKNKRPNAKDYKVLPRSEWTIVENCHEAVKTQEEHDAIIKMIDSRILIPHKSRKQIHVFTGLIKCAICGHAQTFQKRSDGIISVKSCWYIDKHGKRCNNTGIKLSVIEEMVLKEIGLYREQILSATTIPSNSERNTLYKTIIESIIWLREGENIEMKINFL